MNSNRGMKKWMPFAALPEHQTYMKDMMKEMEKVDRPELSEYQKSEINESLKLLKTGDSASVTHYKNGHILKEKVEFEKLDLYSKVVICKSVTISFENLLSIEI